MPKQYNAAGYVADPTDWYQPEPGSGKEYDFYASEGDKVVPVTPGERYVVHNTGAVYAVYAGFATQATEGNRLWIINPRQKAGINIPIGVTNLYFRCVGSGSELGTIHLVRVLG